MKALSRVGVVLSVIFGCLLLALFAELYYLLCWKKKRIAIPGVVATGSSIERGLACSDFDTVPKSSRNNFLNLQRQEDDRNLDTDKEFVFKTAAEGPGEELCMFHGPPRFLFTIVEETKEDLESDDGKGGARVKRSLGDFLSAVECQTPFLTPVASPSLFAPPVSPYGTRHPNGGFSLGSGFDPSTFESGRDAEFNRMRCSPPPKFKFLQDAEEKLRKKLMEVDVVWRVNVDRNTLPSRSSLRLASADERVITINI